MKTTRQHALHALTNVIYHGHSWERTDFTDVAEGERSFAKALCLGVIRHCEQLLWIEEKLIKKPLKNKDIDIRLIVLMGIYEIWKMQTPDYAAIDETVSVVQKKKQWAKSLVNATLHNFIKDKEKFTKTAGNIPCCPDWIIQRIKQDYPTDIKNILTEMALNPPQHCRVNQQKISVAEYIKQYCADIEVETHTDFPDALTFKTPRGVEDIPGFFDGLISIQDLAPQQTPYHLDLKPGMHILDACAAPGGKTGHLLEACPEIHLTAWDIDANRLERVQENLERLGLLNSHVLTESKNAIFSGNNNESGEILPASAKSRDRLRADGKSAASTKVSLERSVDKKLTADSQAINNNFFDRILVDAPCSGLGVVRRHPDIKLHRTPEDIANLSKTQLKLLNSLWAQLKPGGKLLYATCSILKAENNDVIKAFLDQTPDAKLEMSKQFLPTTNGPDGFYYALLTK